MLLLLFVFNFLLTKLRTDWLSATLFDSVTLTLNLTLMHTNTHTHIQSSTHWLTDWVRARLTPTLFIVILRTKSFESDEHTMSFTRNFPTQLPFNMDTHYHSPHPPPLLLKTLFVPSTTKFLWKAKCKVVVVVVVQSLSDRDDSRQRNELFDIWKWCRRRRRRRRHRLWWIYSDS